MKLSIVIPVYNTGNTLERCVESVLGQNYDDYELILVDDGSTDNSPSLCDLYAVGFRSSTSSTSATVAYRRLAMPASMLPVANTSRFWTAMI